MWKIIFELGIFMRKLQGLSGISLVNKQTNKTHTQKQQQQQKKKKKKKKRNKKKKKQKKKQLLKYDFGHRIIVSVIRHKYYNCIFKIRVHGGQDRD